MYLENHEQLIGGRSGKIQKIGRLVVRPAQAWTNDVHSFLRFVRAEGAEFVPMPYGMNELKQEQVSYMPGEVFNYPLPDHMLADSMLVSAARLLRTFHQYSERYLAHLTGQEHWMLEKVSPVEVMCHGDFAPYNVTIISNQAVGMIDFDTLHPGPRMWDVAYAVYRWVPFNAPMHPDAQGDLYEHIRKARLFLDTYGIGLEGKESFVRILIERLEALTQFMRNEAKQGNEDFQSHIQDGHLSVYVNDMEYLRKNEQQITKGIIV